MGAPVFLFELIKKCFPLRFFGAQMASLPLMDRLVDQVFFKNDRILYVPKQRVTVREAIAAPENALLPGELAAHFIRSASHRFIMKECLCRTAADCHDYPQELGCIFLGPSAAHINPALGRMASVEEALDHQQRCAQAGLFHMIGRGRIDAIWLGVRPGKQLMTICNCCPCCCLFRMLPHLPPVIQPKISRLPGVEFEVNGDCVACGRCASQCFVQAVHIEEGRAAIDPDICRGCGHCADICPKKAIHLRLTRSDVIETATRMLSEVVSVNRKPD